MIQYGIVSLKTSSSSTLLNTVSEENLALVLGRSLQTCKGVFRKPWAAMGSFWSLDLVHVGIISVSSSKPLVCQDSINLWYLRQTQCHLWNVILGRCGSACRHAAPHPSQQLSPVIHRHKKKVREQTLSYPAGLVRQMQSL